MIKRRRTSEGFASLRLVAPLRDNFLNNLFRAKTPGGAKMPVAELKTSHSYLSATIGSTFVARRAGTKQAVRATPVSNTDTAINVIASVALTL